MILYEDIEDVGDHCPDDLIDFYNEIKGDYYVDYGEEVPSEELINAYAIMCNFLSNKFNKAKLISNLKEDDDFIKYLPSKYDPEKHLDTINSLLHIIHLEFPQIKELSIKPAIEYMKASGLPATDFTSKLNIEYGYGDIKYDAPSYSEFTKFVEEALANFDDLFYVCYYDGRAYHESYFNYDRFSVEVFATNKETLALANETLLNKLHSSFPHGFDCYFEEDDEEPQFNQEERIDEKKNDISLGKISEEIKKQNDIEKDEKI